MTDSNHSDHLEVDGSIADAIESNGQLLHQLLTQFEELRSCVADRSETHTQSDPHTDSHSPSDLDSPEDLEQVCEDLQLQVLEYEEQVADLHQRIADLEEQNSDLATQVANRNVRQAVACSDSGSNDALSWEDRKQLILQQMEEDSFDAEAFVSELATNSNDDAVRSSEVPAADFVQQLHDEVIGARSELDRRDAEIHELRSLLEEHSGTRGDGVAIGAAAIAEMVDADELIQQERERLQALQTQWEEKFRETEIETSLERAKLSRERLELARKNSELEERLEHLQRETRHAEESGPSSRRWLAKLGLAD